MPILKVLFLALIIAPYYLAGFIVLIGLAAFLLYKAERARKEMKP